MTTGEERKRFLDEEVEASEASMNDPAPAGGARRSANRTEVMSLRLSAVELNAIQRKAEQAGVPASELVRSWIRQGLVPDSDESVTSTVEALQRDVDRLKRQLVDA